MEYPDGVCTRCDDLVDDLRKLEAERNELRAQLEAHGKIFDQLGLDVDEWRGNGIDSGELAECIDFAIMRHNAILKQ